MADKYESVTQLASHQKEGRDFRIEILDRGSPVTVFAFHGGGIETWTSPISRALAGDDWNLYLFEGIKADANGELHVTSHRFDEPRARALAKRSEIGIAIHGAVGNKKHSVCIGGSDRATGAALAAALEAIEPALEVENPCREFPGDHPDNPISFCRRGGVQLELSRALRRDLMEGSASKPLFRAFSQALRAAVGRSI